MRSDVVYADISLWHLGMFCGGIAHMARKAFLHRFFLVQRHQYIYNSILYHSLTNAAIGA